MTAQLVLDATEHAVWTRGRQGRQISGVIQHHDHGSQGGFQLVVATP
jgi:putative transposase